MNLNVSFVDVILCTHIFCIPLPSFIKVAGISAGNIQLKHFSETVLDLKAIPL
jgi:hypothetical protein